MKQPATELEGSEVSVSPVTKERESPSSSNNAAADLIRELDSAFSNMNTNAVAAARDAEEARRNARTASELVRLYQQQSSSSSGVSKNLSSDSMMPGTPAAPKSALSDDTPNTRSFIPMTPLTPPTNTRKAFDGVMSPAEDVLALSLELERTKQALAEEQALQEENRKALDEALQKNKTYEDQLEAMVDQRESDRHTFDTTVAELQSDLKIAQQRVEAAEEDAEQALELANANMEAREQTEEWLESANYEIQTLRAHIASQQKELLRMASSPQNKSSPSSEPQNHDGTLETIVEEDLDPGMPSRPARSLVAAGRELLQRSIKEPMVLVPSPGDAAERRRRMKERLDSVAATNSHSTESSPSSTSSSFTGSPPKTPQHQHNLGASVEAIAVSRRSTKILKESGKRLRLNGRWFTGMNTGPDELHLDAITRHYCMEVEGIIDKKSKEIIELESLCALYESGSPSSGPEV